MKTAILVILALVVAISGCKTEGGDAAGGGGSTGGASPASSGGDDSMFGAFDAKAELAALQGAWKVKDSAFGKELSDWTVKDNKVTIKKGDSTKEGELEIQAPGELAFVEKSGGGSSRTYYAYARSGADVYIGLGTAGVKQGDDYMVGDDGVVVMKANTCKYFKKKMFGGFEKPADVKCEVKDEGGKKVFSYQVPDRFKKGEFKTSTVEVVGEALLNDQMKSHKAEKAQ